jgi:acetylglutamate kinase
VRAELIHRLLDHGLTPVISTVGANKEGELYNVNADEAARAIAVAMNAEKIVYLTAAPGLLEDVSDESSLVHRLTAAELRERFAHESVGKGMIPSSGPARTRSIRASASRTSSTGACITRC